MALRGPRLVLALMSGLVVVIVLGALYIWQDDILQAFLDPKIPYAVYKPPLAPDYRLPTSWSRLPGPPQPGDPPADVFFIPSTTFDGGRDWNAPIGDRPADRRLTRDVIPNYAAPFAAVGRVFVPRYRQASLYSSLSLFDDALEARAFAYDDIDRAFQSFLARIGPDRPFLVVGVEQGGLLASRLLTDRVANHSALRRRLIAAYLIETAVPASAHGPGSRLPGCVRRDEWGCLVAWISAPRLDFVRASRILTRSVVWNGAGRLTPLAGREPLCVNPLLGAASGAEAPARLNRGAANATGLEWGVRPGFMARQVAARCVGGILRVTRPRSAALRPSGGWARRLRAAPFNLFWADLEADAEARAAAWFEAQPASA